MMRHLGSVVAVIAATAGSARGQAAEWRIEGGNRLDALGSCVRWVEDLDGDGTRDCAIVVVNPPTTGSIELRSGVSGQLIRAIESTVPVARFGRAIEPFDDLDGDGFGELLIAADQRIRPGIYARYGAVDVISPATGALLRTDYETVAESSSYVTLARFDDIDGDGVSDYFAMHSILELRSGATGALLRTHLAGATLRHTLVTLDDVDGDQVRDYAFRDNGFYSGDEIDIHSGATGLLVHRIDAATFSAPLFDLMFGFALASTGDIDGDGAGDFVGGGLDLSLPKPYDGFLFAISGGSGQLLWRVDGTPGLGEWLGQLLVVGGDVDGDGDRDVLSLCAAQGLETFDLATGARGGLIATPQYPHDFACDVDLTGDGRDELLLGSPKATEPDQLADAGWYGLFDPVAATLLHEQHGESWASRLGRASIVIEDRNGDGWRDLVIGAPGGDGDTHGLLLVVSARDGSELARFVSPTPLDEFGASLAAVADHDGDAIVDWLVGAPGAAGGGQVQLLSGASGAPLWTIAPPTGAARFGTSIAAMADASGRWIAAIADPSNATTTPIGRVDFLDLATRLPIGSRSGAANLTSFAVAVAAIGDTTGDGVPEFAIGGTLVVSRVQYGYLELTDGATLATLWSRDGRTGQVGRSISTIADLDGDALPDLVTGYCSTANISGDVTACSGSDGHRLWSHSESGGPGSMINFGETVRAIGDVDQDGVADLLVGVPVSYTKFAAPYALNCGAIDLRSGATGNRLKRWYGPFDNPSRHGANLAAGGVDGSYDLDGDGMPELIGGGDNHVTGVGALRHYYLEMRRLTPTLLELDAPDAWPNYYVTASVRGGPPGAAAGIFLVDFAGAPVNQFLVIGTLDSKSSLSLFDQVPVGLTGLDATLRGYAIGYGGKLQASDDEVLTFR